MISSRRERQAWKVKGSMSTWRRPRSWSPMLELSSRNPASTPAVVSATSPSCARKASCWSTGGTVRLVADPNYVCHRWQYSAHQWQNRDWSACRRYHAWCGGHSLLPRRHAVVRLRLWQCHCRQMFRGLWKVRETLASPNQQIHRT